MIRIEIDVDIDDAMRFVQMMGIRAKNFIPAFEWARRELAKANAENFTAHGLPAGGWSPRTREYGWPILRKSGALFRSLSSLRGPGNQVSLTHAYFGTDIEYAKFHQYGTRKMAARKVVFEPRGFGQELGEKAAKHIIGLRASLLP
jgi:phage gpG-like protein